MESAMVSNGPSLAGGVSVADNCNENKQSYALNVGNHDINETGMEGKTFFHGSRYCDVAEIQGVQILDSR
jgi:hypothetical protein